MRKQYLDENFSNMLYIYVYLYLLFLLYICAVGFTKKKNKYAV